VIIAFSTQTVPSRSCATLTKFHLALPTFRDTVPTKGALLFPEPLLKVISPTFHIVPRATLATFLSLLTGFRRTFWPILIAGVKEADAE
jgi:hypothetical protein